MTATEITRIVVIAIWAITTGMLVRLRAPKVAAIADRPDIQWWLLALAGIVGGALGVTLSNQRYRHASPLEQRSLQWFGLSIAVAAEVCIVVLALHVIAEWPSSISATAISTTA